MTAAPSGADAGEDPAELPVQPGERIVALDYLRGIALLGILFANIVAFAHPMLAYSWPAALPGGGSDGDRWIWLVQFVAIDGKFRGLFSLLFGAGLYLFAERSWARGGSGGLQFRRLVWLLLFGAAHFYLLFVGDILFLYALSGFAALAMLGWSARTQLLVGLAWYLLGSLAYTLMLAPQASLEASAEARARSPATWEQVELYWQDRRAEAADEAATIIHGDYSDVLAFRFAEQSELLPDTLTIALVETIPLMLIGMALFRLRLFDQAPGRRRRVWSWAGVLGGGLATLGLGIWPMLQGFPPNLTQFVFNGPAAFPRLAMIIGLASLLSASAPRAAQSWLGERLIAAGRMAFSNYIATSLVMMLIFHGWAGGFYGQMGRAELLPVVLLGWLLIVAWSRPWLDRFHYGPLEWIWRCLTYGRIFPLRRAQKLATASHSH